MSRVTRGSEAYETAYQTFIAARREFRDVGGAYLANAGGIADVEYEKARAKFVRAANAFDAAEAAEV